MEDYALTTEILVVYLMSRWDLTLVVEEVVLVNWPARSVCFFYHIFPNVRVFRFIGIGPFKSPAYEPVLLYGYRLPSTLQELSLDHCSLLDTSIEETLGPRSEVQTVSLNRVAYGYVAVPITLGDTPTESDMVHRKYWQMCHELDPDSSRHPPSPPTLRKLCIDFITDYDHPECTQYHMLHLLHDQLFSATAARAAFAALIPPGHMFPVAMRCDLLEELNIIMGDLLWCVQSDIWQCMRLTLSTLSLIIPHATEYALGRTVVLSNLCRLQHLKLDAFLPNVALLLNTVGTWMGLLREATSSCMVLKVNMTHSHYGSLATVL
ncbi:uncharacterized protein ARMOST_11523 [Armillaria ostoyae]|uniref:Uncharacterized protein n=1 Tax=Armillaria ostoyae TaxID=47428 RepID=A0A284RHD4_ARMOS|nr:uncharacterized protein ARMOST_11523 [Armillaria ostoyae]